MRPAGIDPHHNVPLVRGDLTDPVEQPRRVGFAEELDHVVPTPRPLPVGREDVARPRIRTFRQQATEDVRTRLARGIDGNNVYPRLEHAQEKVIGDVSW